MPQSSGAARSGVIPNNGSSWFEFDVDGPATVSFWYYVSAANGDELSFGIKGAGQQGSDVQFGENSANWTKVTYNLEPGLNTLRWTFAKDSSGSGGSDAAWVDFIEISNTPTESLAQALNLPAGVTVRTPDTAPNIRGWFVTNRWAPPEVVQDAPLSVRSPYLRDGQSGWFEFDVDGPATVSFWYYVNAATGDELSFGIKGAGQQGSDVQFGENSANWTKVTYNLEPGLNTLRWTFAKDSSGSGGSDAAWVDFIEISNTPTESLAQALNLPAGVTVRTPDTAPNIRGWFVTNRWAPPEVVQDAPLSVRSPYLRDGQSGWFELDVDGPATVSFWYYVNAATGDLLSFGIKGAGQQGSDVQFGENSANWTKVTYNLEPGLNTLRWTFAKDSSGSGGSDAAWVDFIEISNTPTESLAQALNLPAGVTVRIPDIAPSIRPWFVDNLNYQGEEPQSLLLSARSPYLSSSQTSWFEIGVRGPGTISFWYSVSAATGDNFRFGIRAPQQLDFQTLLTASNASWRKVTYSLGEGTSTVRWSFSKDSSGMGGSDAAWVDMISTTGTPLTSLGAALRPVLGVEIIRDRIDPDRRAVNYRYAWSSSGEDPVVVHGPTSSLTDSLRDGDSGIRFDADETWSVLVTALDSSGSEVGTAEGRYVMLADGSFRLVGWVFN